ncbi:transposase [Kitasatospora sp. NPDC004531]
MVIVRRPQAKTRRPPGGGAMFDQAMSRIAGRLRRVEHLGADDGVLIVDETGFLRKDRRTTGVQRQYTGRAGRIENCQVDVFLTYASRHGRALTDRRLHLPEQAWCEDAERRTRVDVPDRARFATKPTLSGQMIGRHSGPGSPLRG